VKEKEEEEEEEAVCFVVVKCLEEEWCGIGNTLPCDREREEEREKGWVEVEVGSEKVVWWEGEGREGEKEEV
jgi:hypothetical protein